MRVSCLLVPVLGCVALSPGYAHPPQAPQTGCLCSQATLQSGWCIEHERGYVFGIAIKSQMLFEAMDTHGHEVRGDSLTCGGCRKAFAGGSICPVCTWGFHEGKIYRSKLTWLSARGEPVAVKSLTCPTCSALAEASLALARQPAVRPTSRPASRPPAKPTTQPFTQPLSTRPKEPGRWCAEHHCGFVGNVRFRAPDDFAAARVEYARLLRSRATLQRCELCAVGVLYGTACPKCPPPEESPVLPSGQSGTTTGKAPKPQSASEDR